MLRPIAKDERFFELFQNPYTVLSGNSYGRRCYCPDITHRITFIRLYERRRDFRRAAEKAKSIHITARNPLSWIILNTRKIKQQYRIADTIRYRKQRTRIFCMKSPIRNFCGFLHQDHRHSPLKPGKSFLLGLNGKNNNEIA